MLKSKFESIHTLETTECCVPTLNALTNLSLKSGHDTGNSHGHNFHFAEAGLSSTVSSAFDCRSGVCKYKFPVRHIPFVEQ